MKKIVFLEYNFNSGGAERISATIMRYLDPLKFEIHLVAIQKLGAQRHLVPNYVKVHELNCKKARAAVIPFRKLINNIHPDVVYSSLSHTTMISIISGIGKKHKVVSRYSSMPSAEKKEGKLKGWKYLIFRMLFNKVDLMIAQTEEMKEELISFYKIKSEKIKVITNPIDTGFVDGSLERKENPFDNKNTNIVSVGTIYPVKGFDVLINAMRIVVEKAPDYVLHIIGADYMDNQKKLDKLVNKLGINNHVKFLGFQANPYIYLKYADLFVLSSRREGLPNVVLEAQYLGKPVVATRSVPIIERLINHGKNGFIVDVEDVNGLADAILNFRQLKGEKIFRNSISEFIKVFEEEI